MKHPSQEDLLGYVLGALDAQQHREVQQLIDSNQEIEEQLLQIKSALQPLDYLDQPTGPPPGLARRTCERVASYDKFGDDKFGDKIGDDEFADDRIAGTQMDFDANICPDRMLGIGAGAGAVDTRGRRSDDRRSDDRRSDDRRSDDRRSDDRRSDPKRAVVFSAADTSAGRAFSGGWSMTDMLVGVAALAVLAGILLPAIAYTRFQSRVTSCQNNMRCLGTAMISFSSSNPYGEFPSIPQDGNLAASGIYAPILKDCGLIEDDNLFACPGLVSETPVCIPGFDQLNNASGSQLEHLWRTMGGNYGYALGFMKDRQVCRLKNEGRPNVILLSDMPSGSLDRRQSKNHDARGQNVLFEDGHVEFVAGFAWGEDPIFENDFGLVAPGTNILDNVIAPSHLSPRCPLATE